MISPSPAVSAPFSLGMGVAIDAVLGLGVLQRLYDTLPPGDFIARSLERLDVQISTDGADYVPDRGPAIVVANHPTGALDGLAVIRALQPRRSDIRVLGTSLLARIPEMRDWTIGVDPYRVGAPGTVVGLRAARRWVEAGGLLVVFPAGAVARTCRRQTTEDEPWQDGVLSLARWTNAPVVPAHLSGQPSRLFRVLGRLFPALGTLLLPRELLRQRGSRVTVRFGPAVVETRLAALPSAARLPYLRARVHALASHRVPERRLAPLAPTVISSLVRREVESLPEEHRLAASRHLEVYCAPAAQIPHALRDIGRLRERTFREVGEGTGRAVDLDDYDDQYLHLFLWDATRLEVAGAYRMGIAEGLDHPRLYTESLFHWRRRPAELLGPSLELGRSFVRPEHQRDPAALLLLWKGIGAFVARHPRYQRLFGPVSISADYHPLSRQLMASWLHDHLAAEPHGSVRGRRRLPPSADVQALTGTDAIASMADLDTVVRELEGGRGIPVLLRQYLRLNGRVLAVSRDPDFGDVVDALVVVDMLRMPPAHLERYCGTEGARRIREAAQERGPGIGVTEEVA